MSHRKILLITIGMVLGMFGLLYGAKRTTQPVALNTDSSPTSAYGKLPLHFEANVGQTDERVKFLARGSGYTMFFTGSDAVLSFRNRNSVSMHLKGSKPNPASNGIERQEGTSNYFIGNDPKAWKTDVPMFAKAQFNDVYPGIDVVYYGTDQRQLEYDFIVKPGADPRSIRLSFEGADGIRADSSGDLVLTVDKKELRMHKPKLYQELEGKRTNIPGSFKLQRTNDVSFEVGSYDKSKALVIDPVLAYSTFLGGSGDDIGVGIEVSPHGDAYVTGLTISPNFPPSPAAPKLGPGGAYDAFVAKISADGTHLIYSTYLGGSDDENLHGGFVYSDIAIDRNGAAYVTGLTKSADFPVLPNPGAYQTTHAGGVADGYVTKLNLAGNGIVYSTYLGGIGFDGNHAIAVDASNQIYLTGYDGSGTLPANGFQPAHAAPCSSGNADAFVAKLNSTGSSLLYYSYLGGNSCNLGSDITLDPDNDVHVMGETVATNLPTTIDAFDNTCGTDGTCNGGIADIFVLKVNTNITGPGSLSYLTYLGGSGEERVAFSGGIAVDVLEVIHVTALTASTNPADFPIMNAAQPNPNCSSSTCPPEAFITKFKGNQLFYSTYLGGPGLDFGSGIKLDIAGNAYVVGSSGGTFPSTEGMPTCTDPGVFVAKFTQGGLRQWAGCISGPGQDTGLDIAVDPAGCAYLTGWTESASYPTVHALQPVFGGGSTVFTDGFVTKVCSGLDHFKCYGVSEQQVFPPQFVTLRDGFETETVRVIRPTSLCNPVLKCIDHDNNPATALDCSQRLNVEDNLVCYETRHEGGSNMFGKRFVVVSNQFGKEQVLSVHKRENLICIPSLRRVLGTN